MYKAAVLKNEREDEHILWLEALKKYADTIDYVVVDITRQDWLDKIEENSFDILLARPPGLKSLFKQLYDERIYILSNVLNYFIYPSPEEIFIYENKRFLSYWLQANGLPHPLTYVSYNEDEAVKLITELKYPIVGKANIGASGSGVRILKDKSDALNYISQCFSHKGAPKRWWPNFSKGNIIKRGMRYLINPSAIQKKINIYESKKNEIQRDFVVLQKFITHEYEWRIVVIGDSYFAHKKLKIGDKASGSTLKNYDNPPLYLFDFAKKIMDKFGFYSQAIDLFETDNGELLINEMQCMFGQSDPYQMLVDGKPGRYRFINGEWLFEEGDFTKNECFNLRVEHVLSILNKKNESSFR